MEKEEMVQNEEEQKKNEEEGKIIENLLNALLNL